MREIVKQAVQAIRDTFERFLQRRQRIARLKAELRTLGVADCTDTETLTQAVRETGPVVFSDHLLEVDERLETKKTAIGVKELLDAVAAHDPQIGARVQRVLDKAESDKRAANAAGAVLVHELKVRETKPGEDVGKSVALIR